MKRRPRRLWALVAFVVLVLLVLAGLSRWLGNGKTIPPEKLVRVERGNIARSVVAIGQVEPQSKVQLKSKANGIIQALLVDVGDAVREGQVLAELDKENLEAQAREATATLDAELASLEVAKAAEAKARIEAANPELAFARRDLERLQALFAQGVASEQALDDAQKARDLAVNRSALLEAAARSAAALVSQTEARVAAARAALDRSRENLGYATIRSPIAGVVLTRDTEVGDAVSSILNLGSAATLIMTLGDLSSVYVKGEVDEADIGKLCVKTPVRTTVEAFPGETFEGRVTRIAPIGKEKDNVTTFEVRVSIENPQGKLRVHMSANAEVVLEERRQVLLVPEASLVYDKDGKPSVQRRDPSRREGFTSLPVKLGISNGQRTEVIEGLHEGDELVLP